MRLVNLHKHFGGIIAVESFDLEVAAGEIVALVGDNGAGKSTLVKMIAGAYKPTGGEIWLNGTNVTFKDASDARAHGVEVVYQDLALVDLQPVYMNLFLGRELVSGPLRLLDRREMARQTQTLVDVARRAHPVGQSEHARPVRRTTPGRRHLSGDPLGVQPRSHGRADGRRSASPRPPRSNP